MLRNFASFAPIAFGVACAAACGGSVVFSEDGEGGSGASASTTTSSPGTTKATTTTTNTPASSSSSVLTPCQALCQSAAGPCFGGQNCLASCEAIYAPGCQAQTDAVISCYATYYTAECTTNGQCFAEEQAYSDCVNGPSGCETFECVKDFEYCNCYGQCFGQNFTQECYWAGDLVQCNCIGDFGIFGTCTQESLTCELELGCCQDLFLDG